MKETVTVENYLQIRNETVLRNQNYLGVVLRKEEQELDNKLKALISDCMDTYGNDFPFDKPVIKSPQLWRTKLYEFCKSLPKGADLHVHGTTLLPVWKLINFLYLRNDILIDTDTFILYLPKDKTDKCITIKEALDEGIIDRGALQNKWSVLGAKHTENIWQYFESLFQYQDAIDNDNNILYDYYIYSFDQAIKSGIFHIELHVVLSSDRENCLNTVNCIKSAYFETRKKYPFFTVRIIGSGMKLFDFSLEDTTRVFENTLYAQKHIKDDFDESNVQNLVIGFDLVNEEDTSRSLKEYAPMLLEFKTKYPDFKYFLHCGESLNSRNDNLIDAYLLGATRVGHGMNLYRYPDLLRQYADKEICLEVCPISNQVLRYTHDLRLHPAAEYLKRGVTIALCSDDPVYEEHEQLTDDFFMAILSWGLGVAEIKQLCINSIMYCDLDNNSKHKSLKFWHTEWEKFVKSQIE